MAQRPPIGTDAGPVADEAIRTQVEVDLTDQYARLLSEAPIALADLLQQGLTGEALGDAWAARMSSLSDVPIEEAGRAATAEPFNHGRNIAAQEASDQIGDVVRSAVLDQNTCDPCVSLDGKVFALNSDDYLRYMPPNFCDGRENCRCIAFYRKAA